MKGLSDYYERVLATEPKDAIAVLKQYGCEATVLRALREPWKDIYEVYTGDDELVGASMHPDYFESIAEIYQALYGPADI